MQNYTFKVTIFGKVLKSQFMLNIAARNLEQAKIWVNNEVDARLKGIQVEQKFIDFMPAK